MVQDEIPASIKASEYHRILLSYNTERKLTTQLGSY